MVTEAKCVVAWCESRSHAKGYCRKHYGQLYRDGEIRSEEDERRAAAKVIPPHDKGGNCAVAGCEKQAHAKGYCKKHYGQLYRRGRIRSAEDERRVAEEVAVKLLPRPDTDRMRALERELERAETMYRNVIGVEGRLKWRRELEELRKNRDRLGIAPSAPEAP